jgi:hypothetical protein
LTTRVRPYRFCNPRSGLCLAATFMTPTEAVVADSAAATDSRDLLERLMIAF